MHTHIMLCEDKEMKDKLVDDQYKSCCLGFGPFQHSSSCPTMLQVIEELNWHFRTHIMPCTFMVHFNC